MVVMSMEVVLWWNLQKGLHEGAVVVAAVPLVALVNFLAEVLLQDQDVASIVGLMAIGLETAKPVIGRTNAIAVENVAI